MRMMGSSTTRATSSQGNRTSSKRKFDDDGPAVVTKYYAVRAGHEPGVYSTWGECQANVTGFNGAQFKSFTSQKDAQDFVAGKRTPATMAPASDKPPRFYGVAVGIKPGVYEDWDMAAQQVKGVKGPKYKKFATRAEAEAFVKSAGKGFTPIQTTAQPSAKRAKTSATSTKSTTVAKRGITAIYTDGSSLGNGKKGAQAGVGVFFGVADERNVSERLEGELQTNQRAELTAVLRALEIVSLDEDVQIVTDSKYSIESCTSWYRNWEKNGWKTSTGTPVLNKDLVIKIRHRILLREAEGTTTEFRWIKGHSNDPGNEAADRLAVQGATMARDF